MMDKVSKVERVLLTNKIFQKKSNIKNHGGTESMELHGDDYSKKH